MIRGPFSVRPPPGMLPQQVADSELRNFGLKGPGRTTGIDKSQQPLAAPWADDNSASAASRSTSVADNVRHCTAKKNESHGGLGDGLNPEHSSEECANREIGLPRRRPSQARGPGGTPFGTEKDVPPAGHPDAFNAPDSPTHTSRAMAESLSRVAPDKKTREDLHRASLGFRRRSAQSSSPRPSIPYAWTETFPEPKVKAKAYAVEEATSSFSHGPTATNAENAENVSPAVNEDAGVEVLIQTVLSSTPSRVTPIVRSFEAPRSKVVASSRSSTPRTAPTNGVRRSSSAGTERDRRFGLGFGSSSPRELQPAVPASQVLRSSPCAASSSAAALPARSARSSLTTPRSVSASRRSAAIGASLGERAAPRTSRTSMPQVKAARPTLAVSSLPSSKSATAQKASAATERSAAARAVATPQRQQLREENPSNARDRVHAATAGLAGPRLEPRRSLGARSGNLASRNDASGNVVQHSQPWDSSQASGYPQGTSGAPMEATASTRQLSKREQAQCSERISHLRAELQLLLAQHGRTQELTAEIMQTASLTDH